MPPVEIVEGDDGLLIEFDYPAPPRPLNLPLRSKSRWSQRLGPMRLNPGRRARIARELTSSKEAAHLKNTISLALYKNNPREKWTINALKEENQDTWGIWVTFEGIMTEAEYLKYEIGRQERSDNIKAKQAAARARKAVQETRAKRLPTSPLNRSLRPPTVDPD